MNQDPNVDQGIDKTFGFTITNENENNNISVALVPAYFDTTKVNVAAGEGEGALPVVTLTHDSVEELVNAGFPVNAVLADGTSYDNGKNAVATCASIDPQRTIKNFLDFIKLNPQRLKHADIIASNANAFDGNLAITFCNPFYKNKVQTVQLSTFYSKYQYATDRIGIDFNENELEFSDLLLFTCVVPADSVMKFILKFW